ncbi:hypothetical protein C5S39_09370 [Candidatus Methanophagaceae archaeon]|nr:hypothetical protein C5S39_09370 [Methanophagales archaeon]
MRIDPVNRYLRGERAAQICGSIDRSRTWLYKWIERHSNFKKSDRSEWFREESRAPKTVQRKTNQELETLVVKARKSLMDGENEDTKYRCIGAEEIQLRMHELGSSEGDTPSLSTIKRIIKRNKLLIQKRKRYVRCKSKKRYTLLNPTKVNEVHQIDFIGPRNIKGYGAISSRNLIDVVR